MRRKTTLIAFAMLFTGCAMFENLFQSKNNVGPANVDDLVGWIERVYIDSEVAQERMRSSVEALRTLTAAEFGEGDAMSAYGQYVALVEQSEAQAEKLRSSVDPMKKAAEPVFAQWANDLESFTSPTMRKRSEARLSATRKRYNAILKAVDPSLESYETLNQGLRDVALFLSHDFNAVALADIQDDVKSLMTEAKKLNKGFDTTMVAARAYVELAALPMRGLPTPEANAKAVPVSGKDG